MSIEVLLLPLGLAAYAAIKEAKSKKLCEKCRVTRVADAQLLQAALSEIGAAIVQCNDVEVAAVRNGQNLTFQKVAGVFVGRVDRSDQQTTDQMIGQLDVAVGRVLQRHTASLVEARAQELGFRLIEQRDEAGTLNYVFEEER
ncbi:hypothetical protein F8O07_05910 [Pseudoclavibacter sp. CFCC 13796]|uniref:hypothetical protein n=1 Tax=Pseudoclavibacter sp. CFCC 13796 TaxID=2615179 RepID=UPI00130171FF|nr:hypothetical protein [Pseudoclavibacter sp. CFCC 13796]KAB1661446.1 hypothetical protein F8O07_05910 [Pseudoclavibacter sp. CFCC 13796]